MVSAPGPSMIRFSLAMLVAANMLPLLGVLFFGWSVFPVMALFWLENVIIGAWNVPRMATQLLRGQWGALFLIPFFTVHYGLFCAIHGLFVMGIFGHDQPIPGGKIEASPLAAFTLMGRLIEADPALWWAAAGMIASHGVSFLVNFLGSGEWKRVDAGTLMFAPYRRVVVLHFTILAGAGAIALLGAPVWGLVVLVIVKTVVDAAAHLAERKRLAGGAQPTSPVAP
ncbi:MAG: hypothetical protein IOC67_06175 [Methylobacterium sp.]|nr:hypothetical protein [Methylobacterium sp.]